MARGTRTQRLDAEKDLYPRVERWVKRCFRCFPTGIDKELKHSRIDVIGVRDSGGELSGQIEIIAVAVKKGASAFASASGQTLGYRVYANRVYLADVRETDFSHDELKIAGHTEIGLIQVKPKRCTEVLSSPFCHQWKGYDLDFWKISVSAEVSLSARLTREPKEGAQGRERRHNI